MKRNEIRQNAIDTLAFFKVTDSGRYGKTFEITVKSYLNGNRGNSNKVSLKGKNDVKHNGKIYEIKSNCGELNDDIMKNDYIIYSPNNRVDYMYPEHAFVLTPADFIRELENCGLIREKKTQGGYTIRAIQTYNNSKKKYNMWLTALSKYPTLAEHISK